MKAWRADALVTRRAGLCMGDRKREREREREQAGVENGRPRPVSPLPDLVHPGPHALLALGRDGLDDGNQAGDVLLQDADGEGIHVQDVLKRHLKPSQAGAEE